MQLPLQLPHTPAVPCHYSSYLLQPQCSTIWAHTPISEPHMTTTHVEAGAAARHCNPCYMPSVASHRVDWALTGFMHRDPRGVRALERAKHGNARAGLPLQCARTSQLQPGSPCRATHGGTQWQAWSATALRPASLARPTHAHAAPYKGGQPAGAAIPAPSGTTGFYKLWSTHCSIYICKAAPNAQPQQSSSTGARRARCSGSDASRRQRAWLPRS